MHNEQNNRSDMLRAIDEIFRERYFGIEARMRDEEAVAENMKRLAEKVGKLASDYALAMAEVYIALDEKGSFSITPRRGRKEFE